MFNEFILYSFLLGAVSFGFVWALTKDIAIGGLASFVLGVVLIVFVFPEPESAKNLADVANNITLFIIKLIWGIGWLAGLVAASWGAKQLKP